MTEQKPALLAVKSLAKTFDTGDTSVEALRGVDLEVAAGEFLAIMGPSGSGKSTLLHLMGALDLPTSGSVILEETDLASLSDDQLTLLRRRRIGFIFQSFNLLDVLTAQENVALPLLVDGIAEREANRRADEALDRVGIGHRKSHWPAKMSGGEQQRVAIARAMVTQPPVLLADEPTGNLDSANGDQVMTLLRGLADQGQTIVMVTHDPRQAARADRLIRLRDGRIIEDQLLPRSRSASDVLADLEQDAATLTS